MVTDEQLKVWAEDSLNKVKTMPEVARLSTKGDITYIYEFQVVEKFKDNTINIPCESYPTVIDAVKAAEEILKENEDILYCTIELQVSKAEDSFLDTVCEPLIGYVMRED
jgi:hypothetical protein